jgi:hypothetical protein
MLSCVGVKLDCHLNAVVMNCVWGGLIPRGFRQSQNTCGHLKYSIHNIDSNVVGYLTVIHKKIYIYIYKQLQQ